MQRKLLFLVLPLVLLLVTTPIFASEQTWTAQWEVTSRVTNETVIRFDTMFKGEKNVWQGGSFDYVATMTITFWDTSLTEDEYLIVEAILCEYEGDADLTFTKVTHDIDSTILNGNGDSVAATITLQFPEAVVNQNINFKVIWVFDWHYTWIGPYTGTEYEETIRDSVTMSLSSMYLADYNKPSAGGFCLGTLLIILIPFVFTIGRRVHKTLHLV